MEEWVHCEIRNLLMMVLVPKPLHKDGAHQMAYLRATVSRVRHYSFLSTFIFVDHKSDSDAVKGT